MFEFIGFFRFPGIGASVGEGFGFFEGVAGVGVGFAIHVEVGFGGEMTFAFEVEFFYVFHEVVETLLVVASVGTLIQAGAPREHQLVVGLKYH